MAGSFPQEAKEIMAERFGHDSLIALATVEDGLPWVRTVNGYYEDGSFYALVNSTTNKMRQIAKEPRVAVCGDWFTGHGVAQDLGQMLEPWNAHILAKLREAFAAWYDNGHMNESDPNARILRISMRDGVLLSHGRRFDIDFTDVCVEGLSIVRLSRETLPDYLHFFERVAHTDYPVWDRCYCLDYCATDNRREAAELFHDADTRREYAIRYVNEGIMQGYLAYLDGQVAGWCNANDRASCARCAGYDEMFSDRPEDGRRVKSIFCFTVAPAMRGRHIATALLRHVIEEARAEGYDAVEGYPEKGDADVYNNYHGHRALYEKLGFELAGEGNGQFVMRKNLR